MADNAIVPTDARADTTAPAQPAAKKKKLGTPFQPAHTMAYALEVSQVDLSKTPVVGVQCLFCIHRGKD